ncbi:MAG: long-chain fatty acid transport protein [Crocinitomicaceae bacterium]
MITSTIKTIKKNPALTLNAVIIAAALLPAVTFAAGYKLNEQSAAGMGSAHAGLAAMAEDASVVFYNPAAMTELDRAQMTAGFTYINATGDFDGSSVNAAGAPSLSEGYDDGGNYLGEAFIPFFYYVRPVNENVSIGLGIFTPFGTNTDYGDNFSGGGFADETSLISIEIQPSIAVKINDQLSVGGGIDIVYMEGLLSKQIDLVPSPIGGAQGFENKFEVSGDDWGYGWNLGAYFKLTEATTVGLTYRSEIDIVLTGDSSFEDQTDLSFYSSAASAVLGPFPSRDQASKVPLVTPESATLAITHQLTDALLLQGGATWTGWSSFQYFDIIATENTTGGLGDGFVDVSDLSDLGQGYVGHIVEEWEDVWAIALGGTYQLNDRVVLRVGYAFDESPVSDQYRTARVPSSDRQWLTIGAGYVINADLSVDVAAGYLYMERMSLDETNKDLNDETTGAARLTGDYEIDVFGLSAQVNYKF